MVGIISNNAALFAQRNLGVASADSSSSIAKLSSGERIIAASDDVAGLAVGTSLKTTVSTLKTVLGTTNQASSLLQIADGGLKNITDILSRQKALAVSANSGALSDTERAFLQQEFSALTSEIDRIVASTEFNGIKLLDGSVSGASGLTTTTTSSTGNFSLNATSDYSAIFNSDSDTAVVPSVLDETIGTAITFGSPTDGGTFEVNTSTFTGQPSAGTAETLVKNFASEDLDENDTFAIDGITFTVGADGVPVSGVGTNTVIIAADASATVFADTIAAAVNGGGSGGAVTAASNGTGTLTLTSVALGNVTTFDGLNANEGVGGGLGTNVVVTDGSAADTIEVNGTTFTFVAAGEATAGTNIAIAAGGLADTLNNLVQALNNASTGAAGAQSAGAGQAVADFTYTTDGVNQLIATADVAAAAAGAVGAPADFTGGSAITTQSHSVGIAAATVTTPTYQSTLQGAITDLQANFIASDASNNARLQLTATVGGVTYVSNLLDLGTTPTADQNDQFVFTSQGSNSSTDVQFTLTLDESLVAVGVSTQALAETFAASIQTDLDNSGLIINQSRLISSFTEAKTDGTALQGLAAADVTIVADGFETAGGFGNLSAFTVDRDTNSISTIIDGVTYKADLGDTNNVTTYSDTNKIITTTGAILVFESSDVKDGREIRIDLANVAAATITIDSDEGEAALAAVLNNAFDIGGGSGLTFQVGTSATDTIGVTLAGSSTSTLFVDANGAKVILDISTAGLSDSSNGGDGSGSILASNVIDRALNAVTGLRADLGALQSRFNFAASNISAAIQNTDAARSNFLDVDVAEESTNFATAQVRLQASISVLAQANQLPQNLLKLIG